VLLLSLRGFSLEAQPKLICSQLITNKYMHEPINRRHLQLSNNHHRENRKYIASTEQLVTEIVVKDIKQSTKFYRELGFEILRDAGDFVELTWEDHQLYIAELSAYHEIASDDVELPEPPKFPLANIRIMVPNVDDYWKLVREMGAQIVIPIADRYYGLRDFIISDPDGFGVRFATSSSQSSS
jgi:catechol 2,3-dioxygenase-like lactoylglutathione lyase family enzyme